MTIERQGIRHLKTQFSPALSDWGINDFNFSALSYFEIAMKTCFVDSLEDSLYGSTLPITDSRLKSDGIIAFLKENAT